MKESEVVRNCLQYLKFKGIFCWRSNTMGVYRGEGRYSFSGMKGVSDILGYVVQEVDIPGHGLTKFPVFLAIECKRPRKEGGRGVTKEQKEFLDRVSRDGGIGLVVTTVEELAEQLAPYL